MPREAKRTAAKKSASGRAASAKPRGRGAAAAKPARARAVRAEVERAPGRGKYDRTRSPDERQKEQLRRLLEAAAYVFAELGWADATVEAIVSRAGMSRRTFYEHFDDLRDCLEKLHRRATRRAFQVVEAAVQAQAAPPDMLKMGVEGFLGGIAAFPHIARVVFRVVRSAGPEFEKAHDEMMQRFAKLVYDGVAHAHAIGKASLPPDEIRVFALVSAMEAVGMRYVMRGEEAKALDAAPILIDMVQRTFA